MAPSVSTRGTRGPETPPAGTPGESVSHSAAHRSAGPPGPAGPPVRGPAAPALPPAIPCGLALYAHHPADPARAPCAPGLPKAVSTRSEAAARPAYPRTIGPGGRQASQDAVGPPLPIHRDRRSHPLPCPQDLRPQLHSVRYSVHQRSAAGIPRGDPPDSNRQRLRMGDRLHVAHKHIPPGCPESNGKVERSHRTDESEFYRRVTFRTRSELVRKLRAWEHEYNHRRLRLALGGKTPAERLAELRISSAAGVLRSA